MNEREHRRSRADVAATTPADMRAIDARLRAARDTGAVPVDPAWVERVVAAATAPSAATTPERLRASCRRAAAAALMFVSLYGGTIALTATAVGAAVVVFDLVWPQARDSRSTMTPAMAIDLLWRADQADGARTVAATAAVLRVRALAEALRATASDTEAAADDRAAAVAGLAQIAAALRHAASDAQSAAAGAAAWSDPGHAEPAIASAADARAAAAQACALVALLHAAPAPGPQLARAQTALLHRLSDYLPP
jgi:hypothetical protein